MRGDTSIPGDKSISHRALIIGALAPGSSEVQGLLESQDVLATAEAVRALGAEVVREGPQRWRVTGREWQSPRQSLDCGNSGTAVRLLIGAAAGFPLTATFTGDESLRRRPMKRVTDPLTSMGARIDGGPTLPLTLSGGRLGGIDFTNERASAQVKSAILLAGLHADGKVEVLEPLPSRDHTEKMLAGFGVEVEVGTSAAGRRISLPPSRRLQRGIVVVPGDPSSAAFPIVAALLVPGSALTLRNVLVNPLRTGLLDALVPMGADLSITDEREFGREPIADLTVRTSSLRGVEVAAEWAPRMIDEYPILSVAAAFASGQTVMHGLDELRVKESDRLSAVVAGLQACGVAAAIEDNSLIVQGCGGPPPGGAFIETLGDHRIAMAFLVLGLCAQKPVTVDRAEMIDTSFPGFTRLMRALGARIDSA